MVVPGSRRKNITDEFKTGMGNVVSVIRYEVIAHVSFPGAMATRVSTRN